MSNINNFQKLGKISNYWKVVIEYKRKNFCFWIDKSLDNLSNITDKIKNTLIYIIQLAVIVYFIVSLQKILHGACLDGKCVFGAGC
ncbi:hypothetical protein TMES_04405 [Thalassospira mesophila]|uniref:Uncharacterized protein n=1 Tax=Thalassospira mesophila TaxID=1293891 RepID=A0A1Y2L2D7_9PROT|nr:hypothetical protein TMES_04405 [Thalassospira mesophila]